MYTNKSFKDFMNQYASDDYGTRVSDVFSDTMICPECGADMERNYTRGIGHYTCYNCGLSYNDK